MVRLWGYRSSIGWFLVTLTAGLQCPAAPATLLDRRVKIAIPAQPLLSALALLSEQAHVRIVTPGEELNRFAAPRVSGKMALRDALARLLAGTHLDFEQRVGLDDTIDIPIDLNSYSFGYAAEPVLRLNVLSSGPEFVGVPVLSELQVVSQYENTYNASSTVGSTRMNTDLLDVPQAVAVITRKLLDDEQAQTLADAVAHASGVQLNSSPIVIGDTFVFRGFTLYTGGMMENGLSAPNAGYASTTPIWGLDSVEVLKGPEAILAGANSSYGGLINLITKQPQVTPLAAASFAYGSYGLANMGWDSAGALSENEQFSYRLVAQVTRSGADAAGHDGDHYGYYLAPSLRWKTSDTTALIGVERSITDGPIPPLALVRAGASPFASNNPIRVFGARDDAFHDYSSRPYYEFEQRLFGTPWSFRSRGQYKTEEISIDYWDFTNFSADAQGNGNGGYAPELSDLHWRTYSLQNDIEGQFTTGPLTHRMMIGVDYTYFRDDYGYNYIVPNAPYNIYTSPPLPPARELVTSPILLPVELDAEIGYLLEDQVAWGRWRARLAARNAIFHYYKIEPDTQHWLPAYGLTYKITDDISVYANSMQGYSPRSLTFTGPGQLAPPETSQSYELGIKLDFADRKLSLTTDAFRIRVNETPYPNPTDPFYASLGPGQTSTGEEFEIRGELAPGWAVSLAYTNMSAQSVGAPVQGVAHNTGNLWLAYQFDHSLLRHSSIGVGINARSAALNQDSYSGVYYRNPGNASTDLHFGYTLDRLSFNLGIRDVFDRRIYDRHQVYSTSVVLDIVGTTALFSIKYQIK